MRVCCKSCGYESLEYQSEEHLAITIRFLGGGMLMRTDEYGKPDGWEIECPNGCEGQYTELSYS